jgi:hypothetical protein
MEKRYQVFISSTFSDLKDERQSVLRAILELDHMPAGMELFPAADDSAWQLIKDVIDASDYYVVIVGGRYGSLDEKGIGYTEKEYDYALETGKPVLPLLHEKPGSLAREKTETDAAAWKKLTQFREKVEKRHTCVYWKTAEELKAKVIIGITTAIKRSPAVGWVRADRIPTEATLADVLALRTRIAELEKEQASDAARPPKGTEDLVQGDDTFRIDFDFTSRDPTDPYPYEKDRPWEAWIEPSWNDIFGVIAPMMIHESSDAEVRKAIQGFIIERAKREFQDDKDLKGMQFMKFVFRSQQIETILVQFRALSLIEESARPRSVKDTRTYWRLTKHGDNLMTKLRAIRRTEPAEVAGGITRTRPERKK